LKRLTLCEPFVFCYNEKMSWAANRRFLILLIIGAVIVAFLTIVLITTVYKTPSCTDGIQNQDETGVDCGGSCQYLCTAEVQPPTVLFTKILDNDSGRTDIIALIENKNADVAAKNVPYRITLYGDNQLFIQEINGTVDLPPGATIPIYLTGVTSGEQKIKSAFLDISASAPRWFSLPSSSRIMPTVLHTSQNDSATFPRVETILANPSSAPMSNVQAIVLVYDARKDVIAASKTIVSLIPPRGQATAVFTWNNAFVGIPVSIEVVPIIPLP